MAEVYPTMLWEMMGLILPKWQWNDSQTSEWHVQQDFNDVYLVGPTVSHIFFRISSLNNSDALLSNMCIVGLTFPDFLMRAHNVL